MALYLFAAGCLSLALGLIHSVMGEILIFRRMRKGQIIPTNGHPVPLKKGMYAFYGRVGIL